MHGSYGSPDENWFRWLEKKLTVLGHDVILEQFPVDDWETVQHIGPEAISSYHTIQSLASWEGYFAHHILPQIQGESIGFIGHSIAPLFMLHMLQKYDITLKTALFVAPFFNIPNTPGTWQFFPVNKTFYSYDFDFGKIQSKIGTSFVVYGDDDPYVPSSEPPLFAQKVGSLVRVIPGGKHCGSNYSEFPLLIELLSNSSL